MQLRSRILQIYSDKIQAELNEYNQEYKSIVHNNLDTENQWAIKKPKNVEENVKSEIVEDLATKVLFKVNKDILQADASINNEQLKDTSTLKEIEGVRKRKTFNSNKENIVPDKSKDVILKKSNSRKILGDVKEIKTTEVLASNLHSNRIFRNELQEDKTITSQPTKNKEIDISNRHYNDNSYYNKKYLSKENVENTSNIIYEFKHDSRIIQDSPNKTSIVMENDLNNATYSLHKVEPVVLNKLDTPCKSMNNDDEKIFIDDSNYNNAIRRRAKRNAVRQPKKRLLDDLESTKRIRFDDYPMYNIPVSRKNSLAGELNSLKIRLENYERLFLSRQRENNDIVSQINADLMLNIKRDLEIEASKMVENEFVRIKKDISEELNKIESEKLKIEIERRKLEEEKRQESEKRIIELKKYKDIESNLEKKLMETKIYESNMRETDDQRLMQFKLEFNKIRLERENLERLVLEETEKLRVEREKINQTYFEIANLTRMNEKFNESLFENEMRKGNVPKSDVKIIVPKIVSGKFIKKDVVEDINETFLQVKKEHKDIKGQKSTKVQDVKKDNVLNVERLRPHQLYKNLIDIQVDNVPGNDFTSTNPKKYIPTTDIPFYVNDEEFDSQTKKFTQALFTKDPKLNFIVKTQDSTEIRELFGNKTEIDVENIFQNIENVTNFSPNKIIRK